MSAKSSLEAIEENVNIPTLPAIVGKLNELLANPQTSASDVGKLVAQDAPIASKVLRIVNSAHYGLRTEVISIDQACAVLGMRVLRNIVMQASVIEQFKSLDSGVGFKIEDLWRHNILTAQIVQAAAPKCTSKLGLEPDEFYTCGLVHDLGMVVLLDNQGEEYGKVLKCSKDEGRELFKVEAEMLGFNHADLGARIAFRWKLPDGVVNAIQYHHGPSDEIEADPTVGLIHLVSELCAAVIDDNDEAARAFDEELLGDLGLTVEQANDLVDLAQERVATIEL